MIIISFCKSHTISIYAGQGKTVAMFTALGFLYKSYQFRKPVSKRAALNGTVKEQKGFILLHSEKGKEAKRKQRQNHQQRALNSKFLGHQAATYSRS